MEKIPAAGLKKQKAGCFQPAGSSLLFFNVEHFAKYKSPKFRTLDDDYFHDENLPIMFSSEGAPRPAQP